MAVTTKLLLIIFGIVIITVLLILLILKQNKIEPQPQKVPIDTLLATIIYNEFSKEISSSKSDFLNATKKFVTENIKSVTKLDKNTYNNLINSLSPAELVKFNKFIGDYVPSYVPSITALDTFINKFLPVFNIINNHTFDDSSLNNTLPKIKTCIVSSLHSIYSYSKLTSLLENMGSESSSNLSRDELILGDINIGNAIWRCTFNYPKIFAILSLSREFKVDASSSQNSIILNDLIELIDKKISNSTILKNDSSNIQYTYKNFIDNLVDGELQSFNNFLIKNNLCYADISSSICKNCDINIFRCQT